MARIAIGAIAFSSSVVSVEMNLMFTCAVRYPQSNPYTRLSDDEIEVILL